MTWIRSFTDLQVFFQHISESPEIAFSFKATGPDPFSDQLLYIQLATDEKAAVVDVPALGNPQPLVRLLSPLLADTKVVKAFHDAKKALRFLLPRGLTVHRIFDSMLALQLLSAGRKHKEPTLEEAVEEVLQQSMPDSPELTLPYLLEEVRAILQLRSALIPQLVQTKLVRCAQLEFESSRVTAEIENAGVRLDAGRLDELSKHGNAKMEEAAHSFAAAFGAEKHSLFGDVAWDLGSDRQLLQFLQEKGLPLRKVSKDALQPHLEAYPALNHILDYRKANVERELAGRYLPFVHSKTGRIHPTYTQLAAATGRFGCSNPNIQSFPRSPQVRSAVVPSPGKVFVMADYSQIELRIVAQIARDKTMLEAFARGEDLHRLTAGIIAEKPARDVTSTERQAAKAVNFGLIYAMGARRLAAYAQQQYGISMTLQDAETFRNRYFRAFTGIQAWHAKAKRLRPKTVRTLSGRLRYVPANSLTAVLNTPVQGTGADILKQALLDLSPALVPLGAEIVAIVHDEILVETPRSQADATQAVVSRIMQKAAEAFLPDVPCPVDAVIGQSWAEKK